MTETQSFPLLRTSETSRPAAGSRTQDEVRRTVFRDTALVTPAPFVGPSLYAADDSDQITPLIHLGLAALLLPTFAYAASVLVSLTANGALEKAVRMLMP